MTAEEWMQCMIRLQEIEDNEWLPEETVRDLKMYFREKLFEAGLSKVIPFNPNRKAKK